MKRIVESQPTRKKLWWLVFLFPILYVVVDNLIYPIDESALLKRTIEVEIGERSLPAPEGLDIVRSEPENGGHTYSGWEIYDMIWLRIEKAWPLVMSVLVFFWRKKLVGDK